MKNNNETKELLDELEMLILNNEDDFDRGSGKYILQQFIEEKSLALGKQEPLAKNKEFDSNFCLCIIPAPSKTSYCFKCDKKIIWND